MDRLEQVAVVTGASRGIGAAIVEELAERGATVIASAHAADPPDALVTRLLARQLRVHARIADVTDPEQVQDLADSTCREFGRIDVLVNNAGIGTVAPSDSLSLERWSRVLAVNLTGPLLCSQAVGRHMFEAGRGVIINIGSIFGETGMPMRAAYGWTGSPRVTTSRGSGIRSGPRSTTGCGRRRSAPSRSGSSSTSSSFGRASDRRYPAPPRSLPASR